MIRDSAVLTLLVLAAAAISLSQGQGRPPTWTDPKTKLMWTSEDNGSDIPQPEAASYCRNLGLAGFHDWRLPEIAELEEIYDPSVVSGRWSFDGHPYVLHIKGGIRVTGCCGWSATSGKKPGEVWAFGFDGGGRVSVGTGESDSARVLCVRRFAALKK